jgi:hypothetical protein
MTTFEEPKHHDRLNSLRKRDAWPKTASDATHVMARLFSPPGSRSNNDPGLVGRALDAGAQGAVINSAEDAERFVRAVKDLHVGTAAGVLIAHSSMFQGTTFCGRMAGQLLSSNRDNRPCQLPGWPGFLQVGPAPGGRESVLNGPASLCQDARYSTTLQMHGKVAGRLVASPAEPHEIIAQGRGQIAHGASDSLSVIRGKIYIGGQPRLRTEPSYAKPL